MLVETEESAAIGAKRKKDFLSFILVVGENDGSVLVIKSDFTHERPSVRPETD